MTSNEISQTWGGFLRISLKTGKVLESGTSGASALLKMHALHDTRKGQAVVVVSIAERKMIYETINRKGGFPEVHTKPEDFEFDVPEETYDAFEEEVQARIRGED